MPELVAAVLELVAMLELVAAMLELVLELVLQLVAT